MKKVTWTEVDEANYTDYLPAGGYVIEITGVEDNPEWDCLYIYFDIAEGDLKGKFKDVPEERNWTHRLRQNYGANSERFFKGFLTSLEKSNPGFSVAEWQKESDEQAFVGLKLGALIGYFYNVNEKGKLTKNYDLRRPLSADSIRNGKFEVPEDRYSDAAKEYIAEEEAAKSQAGASSIWNDDDVPF